MVRSILVATLVAGALDILSAFVFAGIAGISPASVLRYVASGPFGESVPQTPAWAAIGLAVHLVIMTAMAGVYFVVARRIPMLLQHPVAAGLFYGLALWLVMYWVVKPLRWPEAPLPGTLYAIANQLFSHCILVGLPIALLAARHYRRVALSVA